MTFPSRTTAHTPADTSFDARFVSARHDQGASSLRARGQTVSDVVYDAMITVAKVPADDKFQIVTGHAADELVFPTEGYLGIDYTDGIIFIQVTWNAGRCTEVKKAFYRKIADDLHSKASVRKQDVFINLVDVLPENWSFGNGLDLLVDKDEIERRKSSTGRTSPPVPARGYGKLYAEQILGAEEGCDFRFLKPTA
jgi:4-oxalocrotonate tautomerase